MYQSPGITNSDKSLYLCIHCGEVIGMIKKKLCKFCSTKEMRQEMDRENEQRFKETGLVYKCKVCA